MTEKQVLTAFLRNRLERSNMSQKELVQKTKLPQSTVSHWFNGELKMPTLYNGLLLMEALGSKHASALMEIWRSWKDTNKRYIQDVIDSLYRDDKYLD